MPAAAFDLESLLKKKESNGDIKVYSFQESQQIYKKINNGLDKFIQTEKQREVNATKKAALKVLNY